MSWEPGSLILSLDQVVRRGDATQFMIDGRGTVSVYPRQHCYVTDVQDWEGVYAAPRERIRIAPATWSAPPAYAQPLEELQWRLAFHDAQQQAASGTGHELLHLLSWPNVTRLPEEMIEEVTRICALLWRKPTVGYLVARVLELDAARAARLVRVLQMFGHVSAQAATAASGAGGSSPEAAPAPRAASADTIASKFWRRLMRMQVA